MIVKKNSQMYQSMKTDVKYKYEDNIISLLLHEI